MRYLTVNIPSDWEKHNHKKIPSKITLSIVQKKSRELFEPLIRGYHYLRLKAINWEGKKDSGNKENELS